MIPRAAITAWRRTAPWADDAQVEQDLVLSRALVELFRRPAVADPSFLMAADGAASRHHDVGAEAGLGQGWTGVGQT